jgi:hypothetical protein
MHGLDETKTKNAKDILSVEFAGIKVFERKDPVYESKILGVPVKFIIGGYLLCKMIK